MASRPSMLVTGVLAASLFLPFFVPTDADARSSRRRNYSAEWEGERRQEEAHDRRMERQKSYQKHREKQLETWMEGVGGRGRRAGGGGSSANQGQSCMYGVNGEVIHRPAGAVCKGDAPAPAAQAQAQGAAAAPVKKQTKGRCVYGKSGKLLWAEPGAEC